MSDEKLNSASKAGGVELESADFEIYDHRLGHVYIMVFGEWGLYGYYNCSYRDYGHSITYFDLQLHWNKDIAKCRSIKDNFDIGGQEGCLNSIVEDLSARKLNPDNLISKVKEWTGNHKWILLPWQGEED